MADCIVFDIETGPLPWDDMQGVYSPPAALPPWHDGMVRYGNTKDQQKRAEKLAATKADYEARLANWQAEADAHKAEFIGRAALSPLTGQVLAVGLRSPRGTVILGAEGESEEEILEQFWGLYKSKAAAGVRLVGFNCGGFDVPFLIRRSWFHGVLVPESVLDRGRWLSNHFIDLMGLWAAGGRDTASLDTLARFFRVGGKPEGVDGSHFATLWAGNQESRQAALAYLANDLDMTWRLAERMGVIS